MFPLGKVEIIDKIMKTYDKTLTLTLKPRKKNSLKKKKTYENTRKNATMALICCCDAFKILVAKKSKNQEKGCKGESKLSLEWMK